MLNLENRDRCFIIAEAGTNHANSDPEARFFRCMKYLHAAARAGVDALKFQLFIDPTPETMFCWMDGDNERAQRWLQSRMRYHEWVKIKAECEASGVMFLVSVFEYKAVEWLSDLGVSATKVASRAAGNLKEFADAPRPLIVSDGMYTVSGAPDEYVLQCEAKYPSTEWWHDKMDGFSDHSGTPWRALDAMARGCELLEVHFYLDPLHAGPDRPASLTIDQLKMLCEARDEFARKHENST